MSKHFLVCLALVALLEVGFLGAPITAAQEPTPPDAILSDLSQLEQFWLESYGTVETQALTGQAPLPLEGELLAKAQPDECFDGLGSSYPPGPPCTSGQPKVNQAYVWGIAKAGAHIWFGTAANVHCLVFGGMLGLTLPHQTASWVCEFGESQLSPPVPASVGDWRPPRIYRYDTLTGTLTEKSPPDVRLARTLGLRSAGTLNGVILLAGPALGVGVNVFAFRADTGAYLGSQTLLNYSNIRKWVQAGGVLYAGVQNRADGQGKVVRWRGDLNNPFQFEEVGNVDGDAAELALHEGRLFVSTWPNVGKSLSGLWMSPLLPTGGLTTAHAAQWTKVWQVDAYEPDPATAAVSGGGALASFNGYLYWGTMHVPLASTIAHIQTYGTPADAEGLLLTALGSHRAISIFRGRNFGTAPEVELLYGNPVLPVYAGGQWRLMPNNMAAMPRYGLAGFFNFFNNYTWSMEVYGGQLFVGTMDWSYLFAELLVTYGKSLGLTEMDLAVDQLRRPPDFFGADLLRFPATNHPAVPVSVAGVGNYTNYGIRNLLGDDALYVGTANPMNLLTDPKDDLPEGGWELIGLHPDATPPLAGWVFLDANGNGQRDAGEDTGVGISRIGLRLTHDGLPAEYTKSVGPTGWYQFDQVMHGKVAVTVLLPPEYIATSPTTVSFVKMHGCDRLISFGVQRARAAVGDLVWYDTDADGQQGAGEYGLGGVTVDLLSDVAGAPGAVVATATTDAEGAYLFDWLLPGVYWAQVTDRNGVLARHTLTLGAQSNANPHGPITAVHQQAYTRADFGYVLQPGPGEAVISGRVWRDLNGNGLREPDEPGIAGVQVCAEPLSHLAPHCATSNSHGIYRILAPSGSYLIAPSAPPAGLAPTTPADHPGFYLPFAAQHGRTYLTVDFGYR